jgi:hypothetical protein
MLEGSLVTRSAGSNEEVLQFRALKSKIDWSIVFLLVLI